MAVVLCAPWHGFLRCLSSGSLHHMAPEASEKAPKVRNSIPDPSSTFRGWGDHSNRPFPELNGVVPCSGSQRPARSPAPVSHLMLLLIPRHIGRAGPGEGHRPKGWACCGVVWARRPPPPGRPTKPRPPLALADQRISETRTRRSPVNVSLPPFWRSVAIPSWSFLLTAFFPLLFKLNSYCSKLNPFFLALSLLTNENNSSLCSWWLHSGYLRMRIISSVSLLS